MGGGRQSNQSLKTEMNLQTEAEFRGNADPVWQKNRGDYEITVLQGARGGNKVVLSDGSGGPKELES